MSDKQWQIPIHDRQDLVNQVRKQHALAKETGKNIIEKGRCLVACKDHPGAGVLVGFDQDNPGVLLFCRECKKAFGALPIVNDLPPGNVAFEGDLSNFLFGKDAKVIRDAGDKILDMMREAKNCLKDDLDEGGKPPALIKKVMEAMKDDKDVFALSAEKVHEEAAKKADGEAPPRWPISDN